MNIRINSTEDNLQLRYQHVFCFISFTVIVSCCHLLSCNKLRTLGVYLLFLIRLLECFPIIPIIRMRTSFPSARSPDCYCFLCVKTVLIYFFFCKSYCIHLCHQNQAISLLGLCNTGPDTEMGTGPFTCVNFSCSGFIL